MRIFAITLVLVLMMGGSASATSLFDEDGCNLFTADLATEIGDLVTVLVTESVSASNRATTETEKGLTTDGQLSVEGFLQWVADLPPTITPIEDLTFTPTEEFSGEGRVQTSGTFTARITAVVTDMLPNGNLVVEGVRTITIAEDTAVLTIRGIVDPNDITLDNTVASSQVADLEIQYEGEGIIAERQHDGILSRIFNFFF